MSTRFWSAGATSDSCLLDDLDDAGEHQMLVGVFVVDDEQAVLGRAVERDVADIVVVVAELLRLGFRRLVERVELGRVGEDRIAPAQQDVGVVARGDMVLVVDAGLDLVEGEGGRRSRAGIVGEQEGDGADGRGNGRNGERALEEAAAGEALGDDVAHGAVVGRIVAGTVIVLEHARAELLIIGLVHGVDLWLGVRLGVRRDR